MKEQWIAAHEELIAAYLDRNPNADEETASEATVHVVDFYLRDKLAARADAIRDQRKHMGL